MKPCKAIQDGKPCLNEADKGQEYCPYHLADQVAKGKRNISIAAGLVMVLGGIYKFAKFVVSKKL